MHREATRSLFSMVERLTTLGREQVFGDPETISVMAPLNLIFKERWGGSEGLVRMTEASQRMMISKPAATQVINRLVELGLVERASDENDRRVVYIRATEAGRSFYEREINKSLSMVDRVIGRMGEAEAEQLVSLLGQFFDAFDAVNTETEEQNKC